MIPTKNYRFDGYACWSLPGGLPQEIRDFFDALRPEQEQMLSGTTYLLDGWLRGVLSLTDEQARELEHLVADWNNEDEGEHNCHITFVPATGTEHTILVSTAGKYTTTSWQW